MNSLKRRVRYQSLLSPFCLALLLSLLCAGCAPKSLDVISSKSDIDLVWPAPPNEPRIVWVKEIRGYRDLVQPGFMQRVGELLWGRQERWITRPYGIYQNQDGQLFVADPGGETVHVLGRRDGKYQEIKDEKTPIESPIGVAGEPGGTVYFTDSATGRIYQLDPDDKYSPQIFTDTVLKRPTGIVFSSLTGFLYVSDTVAHQVVAFNLSGAEEFRFGARGGQIGEFNFPTDLAVDNRGRLLVTDSLNSRIQIFSAEGQFISTFGEAGDVAGTFYKPKGVAVDSFGHVYICDTLQDSIQIFDDRGQYLMSFGTRGHRPGEFWMPSGIFIDNQNQIYVADSYNRRVQVFQFIHDQENSLW